MRMIRQCIRQTKAKLSFKRDYKLVLQIKKKLCLWNDMIVNIVKTSTMTAGTHQILNRNDSLEFNMDGVSK